MMGSSDPAEDGHQPFFPTSGSHPLLSDASASHPLSSPPLSPSPPPSSDPSSFSLFDHDDDPAPPSPTVVRSLPLPPLFPSITVGSPQKELDPSSASLLPGSSSSFVSYLITSTSSDSSSACSVRRRFRDFVTLSDRLAEAYRGFFIPPRPDKAVVESQVMHRNDFVEQRRAAIERYLRRLAEHPVIGRGDELRVFLTAQGRLPMPTSTDVASRMLDGAARLPSQLFGEGGAAVAPQPQDVVQPAKGGRDLLRIFKELKQSMVNDWGGGRPAVAEEDREFLERKEKLKDLEQQLSTASQQAEALVKSKQDMGETMGQLGLSLIKLTKFETEEAVYSTQKTRAIDIRLVATAAVKASRLHRESTARTVKHLDTLHEYLGLMLSVHSAFQERSSALLTAQTLLSDLSSLHAKAEKLEAASSKVFGGDKSRNHKLDDLKETIRTTEDSKCVALREYERIKENNKNELERLDLERQNDFLNMLKGFVTSQVGYAEKIAGVWEKVMEEKSKYAKERQ